MSAYMKIQNGMKPQDILVLLTIIAYGKRSWLNKDIAQVLRISAAEVSDSLKRSVFARMIDSSKKEISRMALYEFLLYGIKYVFPVRPSEISRGIVTAHSASPLNDSIVSGNDNYVWPYVEGTIKGQVIEPLYKTLPEAVACFFTGQIDEMKFRDSDVMQKNEYQKLYELLTLVDAIRVGRAREVNLARKELEKRILNDKS